MNKEMKVLLPMRKSLWTHIKRKKKMFSDKKLRSDKKIKQTDNQ